MRKPVCFINYHSWTNSVALTIYYEHFMLVGYIFGTKGGTGWDVYEKARPSKGDIEIPFEIARMFSFLIDPKAPLTGKEEEKMKNDADWCFVTYPTPLHGPWDWISDIMPYEAYLNARESGCYQHTDYCTAHFSSFEEAKKVYEEITKFKEISHEEKLDAFYKSCKQNLQAIHQQYSLSVLRNPFLREDVSVEEMANILDNFMFDYDPYHYEDTIGKETEAREAEKERLAKDISNGEVQSIINFLREARDEASDIPTQNICEQLQVELAKLELRLKDPVEYEKAFPTRYYNTETEHAKLKKHEMER